MKNVEFMPDPAKARYDASHISDGELSDEFIKFGAPGVIIAKNIPVPDFRVEGNALYLMKVPGCDLHTVPHALQTLAELAANHQYAHSDTAKNKLGFIVARNPVLEHGRTRIGQEWHGHALPPNAKGLQKLRGSFGELAGKNFDHIRLAANDSVNDYLFSALEPTFYQAEEAREDLNIQRKLRGLLPQNSQAIPAKRAPDNSMLFITSRVFHKAPDDDDIAPDNFGRERLMIDITYLPVEL